jgi:hypothetical protein
MMMTENKDISFNEDKITFLYRKQKKTGREFHIEVEDVTVIFSD